MTRMEPESTRDKVLRLTKAGATPREIASVTNTSVQNIWKHIKRLRRDGLLDEESAA